MALPRIKTKLSPTIVSENNYTEAFVLRVLMCSQTMGMA
jgi:hypothetical protein